VTKDALLSNLRPSIRKHLLGEEFSTYSSAFEATLKAETKEDKSEIAKENAMNILQVSDLKEDLKNFISETVNSIQLRNFNKRNIPSKGKTNQKCYFCNKPGHKQKDCWNYQKARSNNLKRNYENRQDSQQKKQRFEANVVGVLDALNAIQVLINDQPVNALIDTGAHVTILSKSMADRCKVQINDVNNVNLVAANSQSIKMFGEAKVKMTLGTKSFPFKVYVADISRDMLLGQDLLKDVVVDGPGDVLWFQDEKISIFAVEDEQKSYSNRMCWGRLKETAARPHQEEIKVKSHKNEVVACSCKDHWILETFLDEGPIIQEEGQDSSIFVKERDPLGVVCCKSLTRLYLEQDEVRKVDVHVENLKSSRCCVRLHPRMSQIGLSALDVLIDGRNQNVQLLVKNESGRKLSLDKGTKIATVEPLETIHEEMIAAVHYIPVFSENLLVEDVKINQKLKPHQKRKLLQLLNKYKDVFSNTKIGKTKAKHRIYTFGPPSAEKPRRKSPMERKYIKEQVEELLKKGLIQKSSSPYAAPIVLVKKKDGTLRFCIDYRRLNSQTIADKYPFPRIDDILERVSTGKIFSCFDLLSGYWQIPMEEEDRHKTAFVTQDGHFEWLSMPFGVKNGPATFQRMVDEIIEEEKWDWIVAYIDDIIIFSNSFDEHLEHLEKFLMKVKEKSVTLKASKCVIAETSLIFLGHKISANKIAPDPSKVKAIEEFPAPSNIKQLRRFLGMCSYYRNLIPNLAKLSVPLVQLTRKDTAFVWDKPQREAFKEIKKLLSSHPVVAPPRDDAPYIVTTDASGSAIGCILSQIQENHEVVIRYDSRILNNNEKKYSTTEKEALALVYAIQIYKPYLFGKRFKVFTDHKPLKSFLKQNSLNDRIERWKLALQDMDFEIEYKPGKENKGADALSRMFEINAAEIILSLFEAENMKKEQESEGIHLSKDPTIHFRDGLWKKKFGNAEKIVVPQSLKKKILEAFHNHITAAHPGRRKMVMMISQHFYWKNMKKDVQLFIANCHSCARRNTKSNIRMKLKSIPPGGPWEKLGIDLVGPLPVSKNGNKYILVCCDYLTKWPEAFPMPKPDAENTANIIIKGIITRFGLPKAIITDRGSNFLSELMQYIYQRLNIKKRTTTAYHPQSNGLVERLNKTLCQKLAQMAEKEEEWEDLLPFVLMAYRSSPQDSTGFSPYRLLFGREMPKPIEVALQPKPNYEEFDPNDYRLKLEKGLEIVQQLAKENIERAQIRQQRNFNKEREERTFESGDWVYLFTPYLPQGKSKKFYNFWKGPYQVITRISDHVYEICLPESRAHNRVHVSRLKPAPAPNEEENVSAPEAMQELPEEDIEFEPEEEYEVEALTGRRNYKGILQYRVKWKGYDDQTWEPIENLKNAQELVKDYDRQHPFRKKGRKCEGPESSRKIH